MELRLRCMGCRRAQSQDSLKRPSQILRSIPRFPNSGACSGALPPGFPNGQNPTLQSPLESPPCAKTRKDEAPFVLPLRAFQHPTCGFRGSCRTGILP